MNYIKLAALPPEDPLRNRPLVEIRAEVRNLKTSQWRPVMSTWSIARSSYNDLRGPWIECDEWRAPTTGDSAR